jgi:hypothetical protein
MSYLRQEGNVGVYYSRGQAVEQQTADEERERPGTWEK